MSTRRVRSELTPSCARGGASHSRARVWETRRKGREEREVRMQGGTGEKDCGEREKLTVKSSTVVLLLSPLSLFFRLKFSLAFPPL